MPEWIPLLAGLMVLVSCALAGAGWVLTPRRETGPVIRWIARSAMAMPLIWFPVVFLLSSRVYGGHFHTSEFLFLLACVVFGWIPACMVSTLLFFFLSIHRGVEG